MEPLISIIVPVYNVEKYLPECFDSLKNQSYGNLEIILVDDGSNDSSTHLCVQYAQEDRRVKVLHKKNAGLGLARNTGLEAAKGKYVAFIDSDDFVHTDMILKLYQELRDTGCDTSYCGYSHYYEDGHNIEMPALYNHKVFNKDNIIENILLEMISGIPSAKNEVLLSMSVWHALYSLELIQKFNIRFPSEREYMSEDIIFDIAYLQKSQGVCYISEPLYFYRCDNPNSLTHRYSLDEFEKQKKMVRRLNQDLSYFLPEESYQYRTQRYLLGRLRTCIQKAVRYQRIERSFDLRSHVKLLLKDPDIRATIGKYPYWKNPIQLIIFNQFVKWTWVSGVIFLTQMKGIGRYKRF